MDSNRTRSKSALVTWTHDKPAVEGYYWYRECDIHDVVRVYRRLRRKYLVATGAFFEQVPVQRMDGCWAGPIPSPRECYYHSRSGILTIV